MMNRIPIRSAADVPLLLAWQKYVSRVLSWSKRLECFAKQDPGRARQSS